MDENHQKSINKPLTDIEFGKFEFFQFEKFGTWNQSDDVFAEKSDGQTGKGMDASGVFK